MKKHRRTLLLTVGVAILAALLIWGCCENQALEVNTVTVTSQRLPAAFQGFRIAHISDLHNATIGKNNEKLLAMLAETKPDLIAITGDMVDSRRTDVAVAVEFARQAVMIAPCYYVPGNHESRIPEYADLVRQLRELGVTVLETEQVTLTRQGASIDLFGVQDPSFQVDEDTGDLAGQMRTSLQTLTGEDAFTVLLSHRPELFDIYVEKGVDLVLSGHAHGGQIRLPFVGGIIAPQQGFFPNYDAGAYEEGHTTMVVSRGIGNSLFPLRYHNPPEILLVELTR